MKNKRSTTLKIGLIFVTLFVSLSGLFQVLLNERGVRNGLAKETYKTANDLEAQYGRTLYLEKGGLLGDINGENFYFARENELQNTVKRLEQKAAQADQLKDAAEWLPQLRSIYDRDPDHRVYLKLHWRNDNGGSGYVFGKAIQVNKVTVKEIYWGFDKFQMILSDLVTFPKKIPPRVKVPPSLPKRAEIVQLQFESAVIPNDNDQHFILGYAYQNRDIRISLDYKGLNEFKYTPVLSYQVYDGDETKGEYILNRTASHHSFREDLFFPNVNTARTESLVLSDYIRNDTGEFSKVQVYNEQKRANVYPFFANLNKYVFGPVLRDSVYDNLLDINYPRPVLPALKKRADNKPYKLLFIRDYDHPSENGNRGFVLNPNLQIEGKKNGFSDLVKIGAETYGKVNPADLVKDTRKYTFRNFLTPTFDNKRLSVIRSFAEYGYPYYAIDLLDTSWLNPSPMGKKINPIIPYMSDESKYNDLFYMPKGQQLAELNLEVSRKYNRTGDTEIIEDVGFNIDVDKIRPTFASQIFKFSGQVANDFVAWDGEKFSFNGKGIKLPTGYVLDSIPFANASLTGYLLNHLLEDPSKSPIHKPFNFDVKSIRATFAVADDWNTSLQTIDDIVVGNKMPAAGAKWYERLLNAILGPFQLIAKLVDMISFFFRGLPRIIPGITVLGVFLVIAYLASLFAPLRKKR